MAKQQSNIDSDNQFEYTIPSEAGRLRILRRIVVVSRYDLVEQARHRRYIINGKGMVEGFLDSERQTLIEYTIPRHSNLSIG